MNPKNGIGYFYRGVAYYLMDEYQKSLIDIKRAEILGFQIPLNFLKLLEESMEVKPALDS